ncbi:DUF3551 domain-containing protein [Bradyrhizobium sp.]|uniref:DUF3551 domain-containing protein n=1 Tax=Bradyrhizobium sp. TaxID=376 RepID=UPI0039E58D99
MIKSALVMSALAALLSFAPAQAQTYDPSHPVCLHVFGELEGERMDCVFSSLAQCGAAASGRPATCLINPYFTRASEVRPTKPRRIVR